MKKIDTEEYRNLLTKISSTKLPSLNSKNIGKFLTGIKDADILILNKLNDEDLFNVCLTNQYTAKLCRDESFWRNRYIQKFGEDKIKYKPQDRSWRNQYLKVISDINYFLKYNFYYPWNFLEIISWQPTESLEDIKFIVKKYKDDDDEDDDDEDSKITPFREAPEWILNSYRFLNLGKEVILSFDIDRYSELDNLTRKITATTGNLTPEDIMTATYNFYNEPLSVEELEEQQDDAGNPYAEDYTLEDAEKGNVKRGDMISQMFFEGFSYFGELNGILTFMINFGT